MKFNFYNSYRFRIILSFLFVVALTFLVFIGYNYFNTKTRDLQHITLEIHHLETEFTANNKHFQSFLLYGYKSSSFYSDNEETTIDTFIHTIAFLQNDFQGIFKKLVANDISLAPYFQTQIQNDFQALETAAKQLKATRRTLGYRDYGTIGNMRHLAHQIEQSNSISNENILQLRRHEKDYLLRLDSSYILKFNRLSKTLREQYHSDDTPAQLLQQYEAEFNRVAKLYFQIGKDNTQGLYGTIFKLNNAIYTNTKTLIDTVQQEINSKNENINKYIKISFLLIVLLIIISIVYLSVTLTRDLKKLQTSMYKFIKSGFKEYDIDKRDETSNILEVNFLYKAYDLLRENLLKNIDGLKLTIEELERTTAYKSSFLANMSHEIRTPLNGIIGVLNLFDQSQLNPQQKKLLEIANYSSSHLLGLINLILDYSKISAGKMKLEHIAIDIESDLNKLVKIFDFQAEEKGIDLQYKYVKIEGTSPLVYGDTIRINQIIINLLNNAIKFTNEGWIKLKVIQKPLDSNRDLLSFSVEDTGIGMDEEKSKKIFQAFEQVDLSTTRKFGGTGLGLTISNELALLMGGELKFKSEQGKGSRFYFSLILNRAKNRPQPNGNGLIKKLPKLGKTSNVLIVDDNAMNQKVLSLMLKKFNMSIDFAYNGLEALDAVESCDYDMIFMDIQMPMMDGLEATRVIKSSDKYVQNPFPIIAVSASAYVDDRKKAINSGIDDFISKPIEIKKLNDLLIKYSLKV
jgi:signal transduction histidine kinase/ActR/RegA family two-component response regulator